MRYYTKTLYIKSNPGWEYAGVYAEKASGMNFDKRPEFNLMLEDCRKGKINYIITKSISRFGRNTLSFLRTISELTERGITVMFENENIRSTDPEMRYLITIYAALAQAESESKSEDIKWGIRQRMKEGKPMLNHTQFLGYTKDKDGKLVIVPEEAEIVRKIFELYLQGNGVRRIKRYLEINNIKTVTGKSEWSTSTIDRMLSNEKYIGDALLQKTFTENCLTGKRVKNLGQVQQYYVENSHEPIVDYETFAKVRERKQGNKQAKR